MDLHVEEAPGKFSKMITDFNVVGLALGILIGNNVSELANTFIDGVIMPTIEPLLQRLAGEEMKVQVLGVTFELQRFVQALMKFLAISLFIFILIEMGVKLKKPVQWVSVRSVADGVRM